MLRIFRCFEYTVSMNNLEENENKIELTSKPILNNEVLNIISRNLNELSQEELQVLFFETLQQSPVLSEDDIKAIYTYAIEQYLIDQQSADRFFMELRGQYLTNMAEINSDTGESTLDRAYRIFFEIGKDFPDELSKLDHFTNPIDEFVKPEIFFDTYLKIKQDKVLNEYFGGKQFSSLEYNITYCGTERYVNALLEKIDFKNSSSCVDSSLLMNLAVSLADYAKNGSYSGSYAIDIKILEGLKSESDQPDSIYLLGSKANYIIDRINNDFPPFVHRNSIFTISDGKLACNTKAGLLIGDYNKNQELENDYVQYVALSKELDTPPQYLIDEAIKNGQDYVNWSPDRELLSMRNNLLKSISSKMFLLDKSYLGFKDIKNHQIDEFINLIGTDYKIFLEEDFNIDLSKFTIPEQFFFLEYIQTQTNESITSVKEFSRKFGDSGFRTFLSLAHGGNEIGDHIINIGEKLPPEIASRIFDKYAEIIDSVNNITDIAQNNFTSGISLHEQSLTDIETTLHKRGVMLLEKFHTQLDVNPNEIITELDRINADTLTTLAIFKHAIKTGYKLPIEAISGSEFSEKSGDQCSPTEINEMETIYQNNWKHFENQELIQTVIKKFSNSFIGTEAKKQQIYTYKKDGKISAFVKFASLEAGVKYASALNVDEHVQGFGLGEAMMDEALHREAQDNILHAMCESDKDSAMRYFEKGFISTGFSPDHPPFLQICWNETENKNIKSKQMTTEQLAIMYLKQDTGDILVKKSKTLTDLHTSENFIDGKCITRCFRDPVGTGDWYAVYETIPDTYQSTTKTA